MTNKIAMTIIPEDLMDERPLKKLKRSGIRPRQWSARHCVRRRLGHTHNRPARLWKNGVDRSNFKSISRSATGSGDRG